MKHLNPINIKKSKVYRQLASVRSGLELDYLVSEVLKQEPFPFVEGEEKVTSLSGLFPWEESAQGHSFWQRLDNEIKEAA